MTQSRWVTSETSEHPSFLCVEARSIARTPAFNCGHGYAQEQYAVKRDNNCAGLSWVLLMLQHCAHSTNTPTATDEKKKSSLFWLWFLWSVQFPENHNNYCQKMSYFKAKMHQVRFRLGLCTRSRWASCSAPPDSLTEWLTYYVCWCHAWCQCRVWRCRRGYPHLHMTRRPARWLWSSETSPSHCSGLSPSPPAVHR